MQTTYRDSEPLTKPDDCDDERELFIDSLIPIKFQIDYYDEKAITLWDDSSKEYLPILPWGYHWEKVNGKYGLYKLTYAKDDEIVLIIFGPDENKKINYNLLMDDKNSYTLSHTRSSKVKKLGPRDRKYPDPIKSNASGYKVDDVPYMPGHCIDHVDTIIPSRDIVKKYGNECYSTYHPSNYIPEIQKGYWGLQMRNCLVKEQRKLGENYAQLVEYSDDPDVTKSNAAVPDSVYFYLLNDKYKPKQVACIDWSIDYSKHKKPKGKCMSEHMQDFSTDVKAAPRPWIWDVNNSKKDWEKFVDDNRSLGHQIRKKDPAVASYKPDKDQLYAYMNASTLEHNSSYASVSTALAASPHKPKLAKAALDKAFKYGEKLQELDNKDTPPPIDKDRFKWIQKYHKDENPGFEEEDIVDAARRLTLD